MIWVQRNAWLALLAMAALSAVAGILDLANGVWYQAQDVTGKSIEQIAVESQAGARLGDFAVRVDGSTRIAFSVVVGAVIVFAFRRDQPWAWWMAWALPVAALGTSVLHLAFGAIGPAISGTIVAVLGVAILLGSAPRFFSRARRPRHGARGDVD